MDCPVQPSHTVLMCLMNWLLQDDCTIVASNVVSTTPELGISVSEANTSGSHDVVESGVM